MKQQEKSLELLRNISIHLKAARDLALSKSFISDSSYDIKGSPFKNSKSGIPGILWKSTGKQSHNDLPKHRKHSPREAAFFPFWSEKLYFSDKNQLSYSDSTMRSRLSVMARANSGRIVPRSGKRVAVVCKNSVSSYRRHLIGFLHRSSHLSLSSELSANASYYLIGQMYFFRCTVI